MSLLNRSPYKLLIFIFFLISFLLLSFAFIERAFAEIIIGEGGPTIIITGPADSEDNTENENNLPSTQANQNIWYNLIINGLEPITGYHLKIYRRIGDDGEEYRPGLTNRQLKDNWHAEGVDSNCAFIYYIEDDGTPNIANAERDAVSDSLGNIRSRLPDHKLPKNPGNYVFEVAIADSVGGDCVRESGGPNNGYVAHKYITIIPTPTDYDPTPFVHPSGTDLTGDLSDRTKTIVNLAVNFGIGIAGGVAFLMLIYGGFKFIFSLGNPENIQQGREFITSAIIGLLVIVFSVFLLRLIGISILGLPI